MISPQNTHPVFEVICMYNNLSELLCGSSSTSAYFVSLPVWLQILLHEEHPYIHTAAQLHLIADILQKQKRR